MMLLKQSTAVILKLGPFVDSTDGVTPETGLSIGQADIQISKAGGAFAQTSAASPTTTHDADGWYPIPLTTTDTGTLGGLAVQVNMAGALPVWIHCMVVPANVYDALIGGSDVLEVDVTQIEGGDASDALAALDDATLAAIAGLTDLDAAGVRTAVGLASANLDTQLGDLPTNAELATSQAAADDATLAAMAALSIPTVGEIADQVWDEALSGHLAAGSTGAALNAASSGSVAGAGAISWDVLVQVGVTPQQGAAVWVATDAAGSNVVAGTLLTDSFGLVTFLLDAGTYYAFVRKDGLNPVNGQSFVVS